MATLLGSSTRTGRFNDETTAYVRLVWVEEMEKEGLLLGGIVDSKAVD